MGQKKKVLGAVAEGVGLRLNEGPLRPRSLPFRATYLGDGVVTLEGFGTFARHTCAAVDAPTAARLGADPAWVIERAPGARDGAS